MLVTPSMYFPGDRSYDIPLLDKSFQPSLINLPLIPWGSQSKSKFMPGTWHFYVEDQKFDSLWRNPNSLLDSKPNSIIEPNWTIELSCPRAVVLYQVYRKRFLSRYWQTHGISCYVDLNVHLDFMEYNLIGVPQGWRAYACRGSWDIEGLLTRWAIAKSHAQTEDILFIVYAGGKDVINLCQMHGWCHFPTYRGPDRYKGVVNHGGI
ncbi:MAG: DUF4417 domain-containing protein [Dolichospermum sp.]|jgi:hypothetical protein